MLQVHQAGRLQSGRNMSGSSSTWGTHQCFCLHYIINTQPVFTLRMTHAAFCYWETNKNQRMSHALVKTSDSFSVLWWTNTMNRVLCLCSCLYLHRYLQSSTFSASSFDFKILYVFFLYNYYWMPWILAPPGLIKYLSLSISLCVSVSVFVYLSICLSSFLHSLLLTFVCCIISHWTDFNETLKVIIRLTSKTSGDSPIQNDSQSQMPSSNTNMVKPPSPLLKLSKHLVWS